MKFEDFYNYLITDLGNGMVYKTNYRLYQRLVKGYSYTVNVTSDGFINEILIGAT